MKKRRRSEPEPLNKLVPAVLRGIRGPASGPLAQVRGVWPNLVGAATASRTRVAAVEGGRVRIDVASAAVKHDLSTFRCDEVLTGLRERLPNLRIREVRYRLGTVS